MKIFAYGSNLYTRRITKRVPSTHFVTIARLPEHELRFHKLSNDGSSKADAWFTGKKEDVIWGAVYDIDPAEKHLLDEEEGLGVDYFEKIIEVITDDGKTIKTQIYYAAPEKIVQNKMPYDWYKKYVLFGAIEKNLPPIYIELIRKLDCCCDQDLSRARMNYSILWRWQVKSNQF